jgi:hypothetical protein
MLYRSTGKFIVSCFFFHKAAASLAVWRVEQAELTLQPMNLSIRNPTRLAYARRFLAADGIFYSINSSSLPR